MIFVGILGVLFFVYWVWIDLCHRCKDHGDRVTIFGFISHVYYRVFKEYGENKKIKRSIWEDFKDTFGREKGRKMFEEQMNDERKRMFRKYILMEYTERF